MPCAICTGWVIGAIGIGVVAGAFFLGGRLNASDRTPAAATVASITLRASRALEVEWRPVIARSFVRPATVNSARRRWRA